MGAAFDIGVAIARGLVFLAALQAAGAVLFLAGLPADCSATAAATRRIATWAAAVALLGIAARSILEPMRMAGSFSGATDPVLVGFFWQSNVGLAQLVRIAGLLACAVLCALGPKPPKAASWAAAAVVAISFALMGHTRSHADGVLLGALLTTHLVAAIYWFGALLPLHVTLAREPGPMRLRIVRDFSRWAVWLVPAMLVAGAAIAWQLLPSWAALGTAYGVLLLVKIGGFAGLVTLGAVNRFRLTPRLARDPESAVPALQRVIRIELAIMAVVLAATAVMTTFYSPAATP